MDRPKEIIDSKSNKELLDSIVAEIAKATGELRCARGDIDKANNRIRFCLLLAHTLIDRQGD